MLHVREYGYSGPRIFVLHSGPGAPGHMAPVARGLAGSYRVVEPFQRASSAERLTVARHAADLHEVVTFYAGGRQPALLGASWGAMLALAYAAAHPASTGPLILVGCGTLDLVARAELRKTIAKRMNDTRLKCANVMRWGGRSGSTARAIQDLTAFGRAGIGYAKPEWRPCLLGRTSSFIAQMS